MNLQFNWARFESLDALAVYEIIQARESVFVVEQQCPYQEVDGADIDAWHLRIHLEGKLAAYARVVDAGIKYPQPSIGRVMVLQPFRRLRIGRALMAEAVKFTELHYPNEGIKIGAQIYLKDFYSTFGFESVSEPYDEDGIVHIEMVRSSGHSHG